MPIFLRAFILDVSIASCNLA